MVSNNGIQVVLLHVPNTSNRYYLGVSLGFSGSSCKKFMASNMDHNPQGEWMEYFSSKVCSMYSNKKYKMEEYVPSGEG